MQILITHGSLARTRVLRFNRWQLAAALLGLMLVLTLLSGTVYNFVFLKAAREGWPIVSQLVRLVVRDEFAQRDRFMRENLDAMAQKVGEVQAKLIKLEAMGERVSTAVACAGIDDSQLDALVPDRILASFREGAALAVSAYPSFDLDSYRGGHLTPVYFGSALKDCAVDELLQALATIECMGSMFNELEVRGTKYMYISTYLWPIDFTKDEKDRAAFARCKSVKITVTTPLGKESHVYALSDVSATRVDCH